jgi:hypothetical protein
MNGVVYLILNFIGKKHSLETREKMSKSQKERRDV